MTIREAWQEHWIARASMRQTGLTLFSIDTSIEVLSGTDGANLGLDISGNLVLLTCSESLEEVEGRGCLSWQDR